MGFFNFPHTRTYDTDLGWLIHEINRVKELLNQYLENAVITFADPITWNITEQYEALTMVIDSDGTAYLSKQPVPAGVGISNTNYWLPVFNYDDNINELRSQIAYNARTSGTTDQPLNVGDLVFWNGLIYRVTSAMSAGSAFIIGTNIEKYTVDEKINGISSDVNTELNNFRNEITGDLSAFETRINDNIDAFEADVTEDVTNISNTVNNNNDNIQEQIASRATDAGIISEALSSDDLVFYNDTLYRLLNPLSAGSQIIPGTNAEQFTVDKKINLIKNILARKYYFAPEDFGAVGDGVTDDSAAIQAMFNAMPDYSCAIFTAQRYFVTQPLTFSRIACTLSSGYQEQTEYNSQIYSTVINEPILTIKGTAVSFFNMEFQGIGRGTNLSYALYFDNDNTAQNGNTDTNIINCYFIATERGVGIKGRNAIIDGCIFSGQRYGVDLIQTTNINTELRGYAIQNCRFHGLGGQGIRSTINNTTSNKGFTIYNNIFDGNSFLIFDGFGGGVTIMNNIIYVTDGATGSGTVINLNNDTLSPNQDKKNIITGNVLHLAGKQLTGIGINGTNAIITNNYIEHTARRGVYASAGSKVVIMNNIAYDIPTTYGFQIESGANGIICNNVGVNCSTVAAGGTGSSNNLSLTM